MHPESVHQAQALRQEAEPAVHDRRGRPTLVDVGAASLEAEEARKRRAEARTALRKLRIKWQDETGEWYDRDECRGTDGADEMEAAVEARKLANAAYRVAYSKLRRVIGAYWARHQRPSFFPPDVEVSVVEWPKL